MLMWLLVAATDSVRLSRLTTGATQRHLLQTVTAAVTRPGSADPARPRTAAR